MFNAKIFIDVMSDEVNELDYRKYKKEIREQLLCMYLFSFGEKI